ncbi:MAG: type II secretion system F family protein [Anaerolineales bacterium]|nr:type II secretion system F family protein [Anaerolineales bacterium]MCX7608017.1 type II secretion system F family protein [Anaerolineales bacterium]MDW8226660.1 type II secretion system F family protein [Anaerolineales bacterium]
MPIGFPTFLLIGGVLAVVFLVIGFVLSMNDSRKLVDERLNRYLEEEKPESQAKPQRAVLTEWVNKRVEKSTFGERIARELARADLKLKPGEYIALYVIAIVGVGMIAFLLGGREPLSAIIGGVIGAFLPGSYVRSQQAKRLKRFNDQLPDMLSLMVNGLRAGFSTMQAMEAVSREMPPPISDEFRRVVQEMQLGVPMEKALANLLRRIPSEDLDFVVTSINVQREVGGNLAEIMDIISYTIRERIRIKGEIQVLTAQVRYSGKILSLMPIGLLLILYFLNRDYIMDMFKPDPTCGIIALSVAGLLIVIGYTVMNKIAQIEV